MLNVTTYICVMFPKRIFIPVLELIDYPTTAFNIPAPIVLRSFNLARKGHNNITKISLF